MAKRQTGRIAQPDGGSPRLPKGLVPEMTDKDVQWFETQFVNERARLAEAIEVEMARAGKVGKRRPGAESEIAKLSPQTLASICAQIRHFVPHPRAAEVNNISASTHYAWLQLGAAWDAGEKTCSGTKTKPSALHSVYRAFILKADALCESIHASKLCDISQNDANVMKWFLQVRYPKNWRDTGPGGNTDPSKVAFLDIPSVPVFLGHLAGAIAKLPQEHGAFMMAELQKAIGAAAGADPKPDHVKEHTSPNPKAGKP